MYKMKNIVIISSHANTDEKKLILSNYIDQLKKLYNFDILLTSHIPVPEEVVNKVNYFIYDSDNFQIPLEKCPTIWFATDHLQIHIFSYRHGYAFVKNLHNAIKLVSSLGYDNFIFSDYDNILNDNDISIFQNIPELLKESDKKLFVFRSYKSHYTHGYWYECKFFAADTKYFNENVFLPNSYEQWSTIEPYKSSSNIVEELFVLLFKSFEDRLYIIDKTLNEYFSSSSFDVCYHFKYKYPLIYNLTNKSKPLFFCVIDTEDNYELIVNNQSVINQRFSKSAWCMYFIDINENDTEIIFKQNNEILLNQTININTIESIKQFANVTTF